MIPRFIVLISVVGATVLAQGTALSATAPATQAKTAPAQPQVAEMEIPKSAFNPNPGRNPFFPQSSVAKVQPGPAKTLDRNSIVLNGITSPPKRTAMINGRTFEEGEAGDIKLSNGIRVSIQCVKIGDGSASIMVNGELRELRLRAGV